jgi:PAS domain S-box-containing protein
MDMHDRRLAASKDAKVTKQDRKKYLDSLNSIRKFSAIADRRGRLQFASEAPVEALGYSQDDFLRKPFWEATWFSKSPESQKRVRESISGALAGRSVECRVEAFTSDGTPLPVTFNISPLKGTDEDIVSIVAETELLEEGGIDVEYGSGKPGMVAERLAPLLNIMQDACFEADSAERLTVASPSAARLLRYKSPEEMVGLRTAELWANPEDRDKFLMELSRKGRAEGYRASFLRSDGTEVSVEIAANLLLDAHGEVAGSVVIFREPSAPRSALQQKPAMESSDVQEALKESEERWHSILNNIPDIIMTVSPEGKLQFINRTLPGVKPTGKHVLGSSVYDYIPTEHHETIRNAINRVFKTGAVQTFEIAGVGPDGAPSWYASRVAPIKHNDEVIAAVMVSRDITERKNAEEALQESEEKYRH